MSYIYLMPLADLAASPDMLYLYVTKSDEDNTFVPGAPFTNMD